VSSSPPYGRFVDDARQCIHARLQLRVISHATRRSIDSFFWAFTGSEFTVQSYPPFIDIAYKPAST